MKHIAIKENDEIVIKEVQLDIWTDNNADTMFRMATESEIKDFVSSEPRLKLEDFRRMIVTEEGTVWEGVYFVSARITEAINRQSFNNQPTQKRLVVINKQGTLYTEIIKHKDNKEFTFEELKALVVKALVVKAKTGK